MDWLAVFPYAARFRRPCGIVSRVDHWRLPPDNEVVLPSPWLCAESGGGTTVQTCPQADPVAIR